MPVRNASPARRVRREVPSGDDLYEENIRLREENIRLREEIRILQERDRFNYLGHYLLLLLILGVFLLGNHSLLLRSHEIDEIVVQQKGVYGEGVPRPPGGLGPLVFPKWFP